MGGTIMATQRIALASAVIVGAVLVAAGIAWAGGHGVDSGGLAMGHDDFSDLRNRFTHARQRHPAPGEAIR